MAKDRARPFSKKHRRYWLPVTGGMLLIGVINVAIGFYVYSGARKDAPRKPRQVIDAGVPRDAGVDASTPRSR